MIHNPAYLCRLGGVQKSSWSLPATREASSSRWPGVAGRHRCTEYLVAVEGGGKVQVPGVGVHREEVIPDGQGEGQEEQEPGEGHHDGHWAQERLGLIAAYLVSSGVQVQLVFAVLQVLNLEIINTRMGQFRANQSCCYWCGYEVHGKNIGVLC